MPERTLAIVLGGMLFAAADPPKPAAADLSVYAKPQRLVALPDGRRMNIRCAGAGSPTVILESGGMASSIMWWDIQPRVARTTRVCSYDRAGYGFSDIGPMPRTAARIAGDLAGTLKAGGVRPPYIVVAFSLGALYTRLFVDSNREAIAGMLLIDPTVPHQAETMAKVVPAVGEEMKARPEAVQKCGEGIIGASSDEVAASARPWGALPLIVMTAGKSWADRNISPGDREKVEARWWALHEEIAKLSTLGKHRLVLESSHSIHRDNPAAIVGAIEELVRNARSLRAR